MNTKTVLATSNEDLYYSPEWDAENLFFLFYTAFADDSLDHFAWRRDSQVCCWSHEECLQECLELLKITNDEEITSVPMSDFIDSFEYPESVHNAVAELKAMCQ